MTASEKGLRQLSANLMREMYYCWKIFATTKKKPIMILPLPKNWPDSEIFM